MENKIIEIQEEVTIGDLILEKGDKIEVLKESTPNMIINKIIYKVLSDGYGHEAEEVLDARSWEELIQIVSSFLNLSEQRAINFIGKWIYDNMEKF